jgi:outer membrane protein OmpA-like peptidoglycan-associated protein
MKNLIIISALLFQTISFSQVAPLSVTVTDYQKEALQGEKIIFINQSTKKEYKGVSNAEGKFKIDLPAGKYDIKLKSVGDAQDYSSLEIPKLEANQSYTEMWMEVMIEEAKSFTLSNLHFATNKSIIQSSSYDELNELVEFLKLKPSQKIIIEGHTDSDGNEASNLRLSQNRANAVKEYLISKGISASRLVAKGFGESKPIADNSTSQGKAHNRRTEIQIL